MGFVSDYDIMCAVGEEEKYVAKMNLSFDEASQIRTQQQALAFVASKVNLCHCL